MELNYRFRKFLEQINPSRGQLRGFRRAHLELSRRLRNDPELREYFVATFLQGSYRRSTAVRPLADGEGSDVDLVLVTNLDSSRYGPEKALKLLRPLLQRHYPKVRTQGRSFRIHVDEVTLDLVLASAPSRVDLQQWLAEARAEPLEEGFEPTDAELKAWKSEPLLIPDRSEDRWRPSHPLAQLASTRRKNARCNQHFLGVVKALKCWKAHHPDLPEHPKSYPLERLIEECCPDDIQSVAEGVTLTLEEIAQFSASRRKPRIEAHGVPNSDVLAKTSEADFARFVRRAAEAAATARRAFDAEDEGESAAEWRRLFGPIFPAGAPTEVLEAPGVAARSAEGLVARIIRDGQIVLSGLENLRRLKHALDQAIQRLGVRVEWDPSSPAELRDYLGVMTLNALHYGFIGCGVGLVVGALLRDPELGLKVGGAIGLACGAARGYSSVRRGWRLRAWYDSAGLAYVEVKVLP
jgi:hypothetical protein